IENANFSRELKKAYEEVSSLNKAKDKVINHLSHELITPVAVLSASLNTLAKKLPESREQTWKPIIERAQRNLDRLLEIQYQTEDIMQEKRPKAYDLLSLLLDQCADELEALVVEEVGESSVIERVRDRIEEIFGPKDGELSEIRLDQYVQERLETLKPRISHRQVEIITRIEPVPFIYVPPDVLQKVVDGLIKNAIENTPDEGKLEITVQKKGGGSELMVHDYGVGIIEANQNRIFEGFFSTQKTMDYSSKRPFDFNAGGKGADLLRMKIFSERYHFKIEMASTRCRFIPKESDTCPGKISDCSFCRKKEDCYKSGETAATVFFPPV
ncbi:MAG: HAMP domain-containing histidine kinase, partial [Deltaproteobacteria bacterium]|nr:HAMP domain-containing histidine kinase [Deltaproteobacteria bacterium]